MYQILDAINYMHKHNVCHRDLKPENLLCSSEDELFVKIADFGLSKILSLDKKMVTVCGTPEYLAPEIILSKPYTNSVDLWGIGVITYVL